MAYVGFRIWYADGSERTSLEASWPELPSSRVQFVTFYEDRAYRIWLEDHWAVENYCVQLHSQDYYWFDGEACGAGRAEDVPTDLAQGALKTGSWMFTQHAFHELAARAQEVRTPP